jgi:hypothetical protein
MTARMPSYPTKRPKPADSDRPKWTILIYLAGDNNLSEECVFALKEIKKVGTEVQIVARDGKPSRKIPKLHVVAQFDPLGRGNPTRRFRIKGTGGDGTLNREDQIRSWPESDTGSSKTLLNFLCDGIRDNDSDYYMVVLSGHAAGHDAGFFLEDDERPLSSIPTSFPVHLLKKVFGSPDLKRVLRGRKINILGFDACMMSTVEVCYQLRNTRILDLMMASEGFALNSSWPFEKLVEYLKKGECIEPAEVADFMITEYAKFYRDYAIGGLSVDQTILKVDKIEALRIKIDRLANALIKEFEKESPGKDKYYDPSGNKKFQDAILLAHWAAQSYNGEQCVDLYDFCCLLKQRWYRHEKDHGRNSVSECCRDILNFISKQLVKKTRFSGSAFQFSYGVSIYFPWAKYDFSKSYERKLDFVRDSCWRDFLDVYLKATQRLQRGSEIRIGVRSTPPTSKGPQGVVHSMRNPPTKYPGDWIYKKKR